MSKVKINEEDCTECGTCADICPDVFKMNDETGKANVIKAEGGPDDEINEAIDACPGECISRE